MESKEMDWEKEDDFFVIMPFSNLMVFVFIVDGD